MVYIKLKKSQYKKKKGHIYKKGGTKKYWAKCAFLDNMYY